MAYYTGETIWTQDKDWNFKYEEVWSDGSHRPVSYDEMVARQIPIEHLKFPWRPLLTIPIMPFMAMWLMFKEFPSGLINGPLMGILGIAGSFAEVMHWFSKGARNTRKLKKQIMLRDLAQSVHKDGDQQS